MGKPAATLRSVPIISTPIITTEGSLPKQAPDASQSQPHVSPSSATAPTQGRPKFKPLFMDPTVEDEETMDAPRILEPGLERFEDVELVLSVRCFLKGSYVLVDFMKLAVGHACMQEGSSAGMTVVCLQGDGLAYSRECNDIRQLVGDKAHFSTFLTGAVASQVTQKRT